MERTKRGALPVAGALLLGFVAGWCVDPTPPVAADTRRSPTREAFKSGGARSEEVLKEISATLVRIEKRVGNIEKVVVESK